MMCEDRVNPYLKKNIVEETRKESHVTAGLLQLHTQEYGNERYRTKESTVLFDGHLCFIDTKSMSAS